MPRRKGYYKEYNKRTKELKRINAPLCECGCGKKVEWSSTTKKYNRFIFNHHFGVRDTKLTTRQEQIIRGTVLGDGHIHFLESRKGGHTGKARLKINHSTKRQKEYTNWLFEELKNLCTSSPIIKENKGYGKELISFSTVSSEEIYEIGSEIYFPTKTVTREYLDKLDTLGLAIWWMDDGSNCAMATHSFSIKENEIILEWLSDRFGIGGKIKYDKKKYPFIYFLSSDQRAIGKLVFEHVHQSLWYKFGRHLPEILREHNYVGERESKKH